MAMQMARMMETNLVQMTEMHLEIPKERPKETSLVCLSAELMATQTARMMESN